MAATTCGTVTCWALMSLRYPSQVSAATGSSHSSATTGWCWTVQAMIPACAMPTACVLVIATGPSNVPDSLIQETPVISPLPFWEWKPAATGSPVPAGPRGWMAVTPVRTPLPLISVV